MKTVHKNRIHKWVDDLRSGQKQTRGCLNDGEGMCCMGRACVVYSKATKKGKWGTEDKYGVSPFIVGDSFEDCSMPLQVSKYFGFEYGDPYVTYKGEETTLSDLNDNKNLTFKQIAKVLENNFLKD